MATANLIPVTSYSKLSNQETSATVTQTLYINPRNILSVTTRTTAYNTTGVTNILYELPYNQARYQVNLIVTETAAAVMALTNA